MTVDFHRTFKKDLRKLPRHVQSQFFRRLETFEQNPGAVVLGVHPLKGELKGYWSLNVTGDYRAIYTYVSDDIVVFTRIGTHSELYG